MEEPALHHLVTLLHGQVSRQCATITTLQRDLARLQEENRRRAERLAARDVLDALGVEPELEALPDGPTTIGDWTEWLEVLFANARRQN